MSEKIAGFKGSQCQARHKEASLTLPKVNHHLLSNSEFMHDTLKIDKKWGSYTLKKNKDFCPLSLIWIFNTKIIENDFGKIVKYSNESAMKVDDFSAKIQIISEFSKLRKKYFCRENWDISRKY